jgi:predicted ATPase with chaperone activity
MPDPALEEALEVTRVQSIAGELPVKDWSIACRPFCVPHHVFLQLH